MNFDTFSSLDFEFNNTTFKFPRNTKKCKVNPKLSEFHKTYRHVILAPLKQLVCSNIPECSFEVKFTSSSYCSSQKLAKRAKRGPDQESYAKTTMSLV